jgi:hypothetical protein
MRICSFLGFAIASIAILYALVIGVAGRFVHNIAPRGTMTIIVSLFFFSGVQLMFIGMIGEYITAIRAQVRRGPVVFRHGIRALTQFWCSSAYSAPISLA